MKVCCEEMKAFLESVRLVPIKDKVCLHLFEEPGEASELLIPVEKDSCLPNVIFRFCPYCGTSQIDVKDTGISFLDELKEKLFPKELEEKTSLSCRNVILEETIDGLQKFFTNEAPKFAKKIQP